jgi:hypothetical protein
LFKDLALLLEAREMSAISHHEKHFCNDLGKVAHIE